MITVFLESTVLPWASTTELLFLLGSSMRRSEAWTRLTVLREDRMWTQGRLANETGVSLRTVSGSESGRISRPPFGTVKKLAWALALIPESCSPHGALMGHPRSAPISLM
jgi:DNA-binding XRE family transcriptional regulator